MLKIDGIFFDTNVFESANFESTGNFGKLLKLCNERGITLYIDKIVEKELYHRAKVMSQEIASTIKKNKKNSYFISSEIGIENNKNKIENHFYTKIKNMIDNLLKDFQILSMTCNCDEIIDWYHETKPPFQNGSKKHEFPDAIIVNNILSYIKKTNENIVVVSNDKGIQSFCEKNGISHFKFVSEVINWIYKQDEIYYLFTSNINVIKEKIKETFKRDDICFSFYGEGYYGYTIEISEYQIDNIELEEINLVDVDINKEERIFSVNALATIEFTIKTEPYPDLDHAAHDTEDDVWYVFGKKSSSFILIQDIETEFIFQISSSGEIISCQPITDCIELTFYESDIDNNIIDTEYYSDDSWEVY